jgi:hypothetical protein
MRPNRLVALMVLAVAGCKTCPHCDHECQDSIVVRAPQQKVIVEQPAPAAAAPAAPVAAPPCAPAAPQVMAAANYPQVGAPMPCAAPMAYGAPMNYGAPLGATVRERTGIGFVIDHINIPIPFPRLIAIPKPSEVTYQLPPMSYTPTMAMPVVAAPLPQMPFAYPPPPCQPVAAAPPVAAPPPVAAAPVCEHECDEFLKKCQILKRLHELKQRACEAAACPPK